MNAPILDELRSRFDQLTDTQRQIATWVMENLDQLTFMTVEEVAAATKASPASVMRFAAELGYSGFTAMQNRLREYMKARLAPVERMAHTPTPHGTAAKSFSDAVQLELNLLAVTLQQIPPDTVEHAVTMLSRANRIFVTGLRTAYAPAFLMSHLLQQMLGNTLLVGPDESRIPEQMGDLGAGDVVVAFGFPRYVRTTMWVARFAKTQGAGLIAVTNSVISPLGRLTDCVFPCAFQGASFQNSMVGAVAVVNSLAATLLGHLPEERRHEVNQRLQRAEHVATQMQLMTVHA